MKYGIFSLIPAIILFSSIESLLRLKIKAYEPDFFDRDPPFDFLVAEEWNLLEDYERDRELFWFPKPSRLMDGIVWINRYGFRGEGLSGNRSKDRNLIIFLGDSVTFGFGIAEDSETYPFMVKAGLENMTGRRFDIINAGICGYSSLQGLRLYRKRIRDFKPRFVVILFGMNDYNQAYRLKDSEIRFAPPCVTKVWSILKTFRFYRIFRAALLNLIIRSPAIKERVPLSEFEKNIETLVEEISKDGATPILMTNPLRDEIPLCIDPYPFITVDRGKKKVHYLLPFYLDGMNLMEVGEDEIDNETLKRGIEDHPDWPILHYLLAKKYKKEGMFEEAEKEFELSTLHDRGRKKLMERNRCIRRISERYGFPLVDLERLFEGKDGRLFFIDERHPTPMGHKLIARAVIEKLLNLFGQGYNRLEKGE